MFEPDPTFFSPELRPSQDEHPPRIEPNLAEDEALCKDVADYIAQEFFIPYLMQAERLYDTWDQIDDMWRATVNRRDLDVGIVQAKEGDNANTAQGGGFGMVNRNQINRAKVSPAAAHKQMDAIKNLAMGLSWENGEVPVKAVVPETVFEHPVYNPTQQGADAANSEILRQSKEIGLKVKYQISFGTCGKYGHCFALMDFQRELETIDCIHTLPPDQTQALGALAQLRAYYRGPEAALGPDEQGRIVAIFKQTVPKVMRTDFIPLDVSAVFIDELLPCRPMERQPCPIVRTHITRWELEDNAYEPQGNCFGWLNIEKALKDDTGQYALSQPDEQERRNRILKRWGMNGEVGAINPRNTIKQLWTAFPLLAIDQKTMKLDRGEGITCETCGGPGNVLVEGEPQLGPDGELIAGPQDHQECPQCKGTGKMRVKSRRFVVQLYGSMYGGGGVTVLRIQRNPTPKDRVPIGYSAHLVEDTSTSRPVSKSEIALSAYQQLATGHNQFLDSKSLTIRRPWLKRQDSPAYEVDCNRPDATIPFESNPDLEVKRSDVDSFDNTATLVPYIQMMEGEVQDIYGANDTVIGEISAGRRAASEITLANEGSKRPLIQQIDQFNHDMMGDFGWAGFLLQNLEAWQDHDWMVKRTGRSTWGKLELFTAVGEEMLKKSSAIEHYRYILELSATNPAVQPLVPFILGKMLPAMGIDIPAGVIDQGFRKNQQDAFKIITKILGDGMMLPPTPDDPDEVYIAAFTECLREAMLDEDSHWRKTVPQNLPLLQQRLMMQQQQLMQKQQEQMKEQLAQQEAMSKAEAAGDPRGNQTARPKSPAKSGGGERQRTGK